WACTARPRCIYHACLGIEKDLHSLHLAVLKDRRIPSRNQRFSRKQEHSRRLERSGYPCSKSVWRLSSAGLIGSLHQRVRLQPAEDSLLPHCQSKHKARHPPAGDSLRGTAGDTSCSATSSETAHPPQCSYRIAYRGSQLDLYIPNKFAGPPRSCLGK